MTKIHSTLACNLDKDILLAALPLLAAEKVEAIEWSFDALFKTRNIPAWFVDLLRTYSQAQRLIGHGIFFSLFSGRWSPEQQQWLNHLKRITNEFNFEHITEHFGFMTGENFHQGAPISVPYNERTLALGQDRLKRMYEACQRPVGLENLAIAYSTAEVQQHGEFLEALLSPINGFIILDLHNFYCHLHNFEENFDQLIQSYPLHMVREIHISGGSWQNSEWFDDKKVRRDTHDDGVPEEVFDLLQKTILLCPNLKYVVLEQLGVGLKTDGQKSRFQKDFLRMDEIVQQSIPREKVQNDFLPKQKIELTEIIEDECFHQQQMQLSAILENAVDMPSAQKLLMNSALAKTDWKVEEWKPHMLDAVIQIAQKWKKGFQSPAS